MRSGWEGGCVLVPYRIREVAERANVPEDFVRRLIDLGALPGEEAGLGAAEVRRSRLLLALCDSIGAQLGATP
jgi:hypothetical protein